MIQKQMCSTLQEHQRSFSYIYFTNLSLFNQISLTVPCKYFIYCNIWINIWTGQILPRLQPIMDFYSPVFINLDAATANLLLGTKGLPLSSLVSSPNLFYSLIATYVGMWKSSKNLPTRHHERSLTCELKWKDWRRPGGRPRKAFRQSRGEKQR